MKCFRILAVVLPLLCLTTTTAQAGPLESLLNEGINIISDDSAATIHDVNSNNVLDVGDVIHGVFEIRTVDGAQTASIDSTILGVFAFEVANIGTVLGQTFYELGQVSGANVGTYDLATLLDTVSLGGLSGIDDSSVALVSREDGNFTIDQTQSNSLAMTPTTDFFGLDTAPWTAEMLLGFDGVDDFYQELLNPAVFGTAPGAPVPINIGAPTPTVTLGEYRVGMSIVDSVIGSGPDVFGALPTDDYLGNDVDADFISIGNNILSTPKNVLGELITPDGFQVADDGDFALQVIIPEPSSLVLFGLGAFGLAGFGLRRRKQSAELAA